MRAWLTSLRAAFHYHRMGRLDPTGMPSYLNRVISHFASPRDQGVLAELARRLDKAPDAHRSSLSEIVLVTAPLIGRLKRRGLLDASARHEIADVLDARVEAMGKLIRRAEGSPISAMTRQVNRQDRLYSRLLRCASPAHLAALRDELRELEEEAPKTVQRFLNADFLAGLRELVDGLEPLQRLPSAEDQALLLAQALTRCLEMQEDLARLSAAQPALGLLVGGVALEAIRAVLATALQDLHQRAELTLELRSRVLTTRRQAVVVVELTNAGQGHARNVRVELRTDDGELRVVEPRQSLQTLLRQQSARLEFLVEPRSSDRVRLVFQLTYDDLESRGRGRELADVVEFRRLDDSLSFIPLLPNPYVVGRPLVGADPFFGREEVFQRLAASFQGARQDNVVVLIGQRRMGKTSILRRLHRYLPETYVPVLVDLQGLYGSGEPAFFRAVVGAICDELADSGIDVEEPPAEDFEADPGRLFRRRFLKEVGHALGERRLLLLFDELEVLEERIRAGSLQPRILPYLRSLMQHEEHVSFLLAGSHRLDELTGDYWGVLFNLAVYLDVGHLAPADVEALFVEPTRNHFEVDSLALEKIYRTTGGHPHFSQLLARELVELRNRERISYVTVQDVNRVTDVVAEKGQLHIAYLWEEASRGERLLLLATKELLAREDLASTRAAHRYLDDHGVEPGDLSEALRRLVRREILDDDGGSLSFRIDLLRRWLDRRHDLESFVLSENRS